MARGVAIPGVREQLFAAADRVLAGTGPAGLTTRAITTEAGVANGVLHRHFADLDAFLAEFAGSRLTALTEAAAALPSRAGRGSVADNLTDATLALFGHSALALMNLVAARPGLRPAVEHAAAPVGGGIGDVEHHFAAYLDAEKPSAASPPAPTPKLSRSPDRRGPPPGAHQPGRPDRPAAASPPDRRGPDR